MKQINTKTLLAFVFEQMDKLDKKEIDVDTAQAQSKLIQQANNIIRNEHERARVMMELNKHNEEFKTDLKLRSIEAF